MKQVCATCDFAIGFAVGPGISSHDEGVKCSNVDLAKYLDKLQKSDSYQREFDNRGFINIFRVEAVAVEEAEQCQFWQEKNKSRTKMVL